MERLDVYLCDRLVGALDGLLGGDDAKAQPFAGNDYVVGPRLLRSPVSAPFTFGGDTLTLSGGAKILDKSPDKGLLTIPRLIVTGNAQFTHGDGNHLKKLAGTIEIQEGGALKIDVSYDNTPDKVRQFEIQSDVSGSGSLWAGASMDGTTGSPFIDSTGSFAGFTGRLDVFAGARMRLEVIFSVNAGHSEVKVTPMRDTVPVFPHETQLRRIGALLLAYRQMPRTMSFSGAVSCRFTMVGLGRRLISAVSIRPAPRRTSLRSSREGVSSSSIRRTATST